MWPDRVSNPGPPTYESGALPIALRGPAVSDAIGGVYCILNAKGVKILLVVQEPKSVATLENTFALPR